MKHPGSATLLTLVAPVPVLFNKRKNLNIQSSAGVPVYFFGTVMHL
jgi:hypothetical protein